MIIRKEFNNIRYFHRVIKIKIKKFDLFLQKIENKKILKNLFFKIF